MSYIKSKDLGKTSKKFLSAFYSKNSESRNIIIKKIATNPYFSFQKREILDYILFSNEESLKSPAFEKVLDVILLTSQKDGRRYKKTLLEIMKKDKHYASSISYYFLNENKLLLDTSDKQPILSSFKNGYISLSEKNSLIASAEKRTPPVSVNNRNKDFFETQLETKNIATAIRNSNSEYHAVRIINKAYKDRELFAKYLESSEQHIDLHEVFDYNIQYLSYVALNDSKIDGNSSIDLFDKYYSNVSQLYILNSQDEKNVISLAHMYNDSPKISENKETYTHFISQIAILKLENSKNEYPKLYIEMGDIIHSNLDKVDISILAENIIQNAEEMIEFDDSTYVEALEIILGIAYEVDLTKKDKAKLLKVLDNIDLEQYEEASKSLITLKQTLNNNNNKPTSNKEPSSINKSYDR